jgi:hypothetical protein
MMQVNSGDEVASAVGGAAPRILARIRMMHLSLPQVPNPSSSTVCAPRSSMKYPAAQGLMQSASNVTGCHLTQDTRAQNAFEDVASTACPGLGLRV